MAASPNDADRKSTSSSLDRDNEGDRTPFLISCGILQPEIDKLLADNEIEAQVIYLNKYLHVDYQKLGQAVKASLIKNQPKNPVLVYGDVCLGFKNEMLDLVGECGAIKVDGLNCIDCLLGGRGKLLETDPDHVFLFLTPGWIDFFEQYNTGVREEIREHYSMLKGIILIDTLGNLDEYEERIEEISDLTGLPIVERRKVGLDGLKSVFQEALSRLN